MTNSADPDQLASSDSLLGQGMLCLAREGLNTLTDMPDDPTMIDAHPDLNLG